MTLCLLLSTMLCLLIVLLKGQRLVWNGKSSLMALYGSCCNSNAYILALSFSLSFFSLSFILSLWGLVHAQTHMQLIFSDYASTIIISTFSMFFFNHPLQCCVSMPLRLFIVIPSQMLLSIVVVYENRLLLYHFIYWSQHHQLFTYITQPLYFNASKHEHENESR